MIEKIAGYKLIKKVKDDVFNVDSIATYNLLLQVSPYLFRICITDNDKNRCVLLEDYEFSAAMQAEQVINKLESIYDDHHVLKAGYWRSIKLAFKTPDFSLVPLSLFEEKAAGDYLALNCTIKDSDDVYFYKQNSIDVMNIFSAHEKIVRWFHKAYPGKSIETFHYTTPLIEALLLSRQHTDDRIISLFVEKDYLTIIITKNKNLELCNTYNFTTPEDFIYYVMFVIDQLQLNANVHPIVLWGDIMPDSDIYKILYKYVRNISLGDKPSGIYFGYNFDELFDHSFYDLYTMHFCV